MARVKRYTASKMDLAQKLTDLLKLMAAHFHLQTGSQAMLGRRAAEMAVAGRVPPVRRVVGRRGKRVLWARLLPVPSGDAMSQKRCPGSPQLEPHPLGSLYPPQVSVAAGTAGTAFDASQDGPNPTGDPYGRPDNGCCYCRPSTCALGGSSAGCGCRDRQPQ